MDDALPGLQDLGTLCNHTPLLCTWEPISLSLLSLSFLEWALASIITNIPLQRVPLNYLSCETLSSASDGSSLHLCKSFTGTRELPINLAEEVVVKLPLWGWRNGWEATTRCYLGETIHTDWKWDCTLTDTGYKPSTHIWNHQHWWQMVQPFLGRQSATWCKGPWASIYQLIVCQEIPSASVRAG